MTPIDSGNLQPDARGEDHPSLPTFRLFFVFLPETSLLRRFPFQLVVMSRFLSGIGQEGVFYGALVTVAINGTPFQATLIGAAKVLPGAVLGLLGGAVADALPRRIALVLGYVGQAALCIVMPLLFGKFGSRSRSEPADVP